MDFAYSQKNNELDQYGELLDFRVNKNCSIDAYMAPNKFDLQSTKTGTKIVVRKINGALIGNDGAGKVHLV